MKTLIPEHVTVTCDCCGRECGPDRMISVAQGDAAGSALKQTRKSRASLTFSHPDPNRRDLYTQDFCDSCFARISVAINAVSLQIREELGQPFPEY